MEKQGAQTAFDKEVINELHKTQALLEELMETIDILNSPEEMKKLEEAEADKREGRVRKFSEFLKEIDG
ncbi:TPA: hypothetical protein H1009_01670 [archaeon]|nr:hypothetical protein [Candidatus Naiadarchaeales archaeon SRR2090153.bin461]